VERVNRRPPLRMTKIFCAKTRPLLDTKGQGEALIELSRHSQDINSEGCEKMICLSVTALS